MLRKIEGVYVGDLDGRRVVIIDVDLANTDVLKIVDDFIQERRGNGQRRIDVFLRAEEEVEIQVRGKSRSSM